MSLPEIKYPTRMRRFREITEAHAFIEAQGFVWNGTFWHREHDNAQAQCDALAACYGGGHEVYLYEHETEKEDGDDC